MNFSYKNRIAFYYMIATAIIMAVFFSATYFVVHKTVMNKLDEDLSYEAEKHTREIKIKGDSIVFINKSELEEREHQEIQVNPVFIQLIDKKGQIMDKSPNLRSDNLKFNPVHFESHFNSFLGNKAIRQAQIPVEQNGKIVGYIVTAMSSQASISILMNLRNVLIVSYLIVLFGLYSISRYLAGRSIQPLQNVTETILRISKFNLKERVILPQNRDEIYDLSSSFNALLERIEHALDREKQFTSDASHELRTPLATLRGTLEVLIRKPRNTADYEEKIKYCLNEIDRMSSVLDQLLLLARLDKNSNQNEAALKPLSILLDESITRSKAQLLDKDMSISLVDDQKNEKLVPEFYTNLIIDNILGNAIKYSGNGSKISIKIEEIENKTHCSIQDEGIGIKEEDIVYIFENFFRSDSLNHKHISGNGLGLSIAKKCADAIQAKLKITSTAGKGTTLTIIF